MRRTFTAHSVFTLTVLLAGSVTAEEQTFESAMKLWSFMTGQWDVQIPDGDTATVDTSLLENESGYVTRIGDYFGITMFDGAAKKMMTVSSFRGGGMAIGHWAAKSPTTIEGEFTVTAADGAQEKHTGRFEILGKDSYTYAVDGGSPYRFTRKK
ncbi:MAG: hypothetical protein MUF48_04500 [Pirellulaceae bacterium]|jgi:hypothetical protein|nr:hypothetical protein [Pirellulaceae bacterium]